MIPEAVLFDMDGTLVDTEMLWGEAVANVALGFGRRMTRADEPDVLGRPSDHTAGHLIATSADAPQFADLVEQLDSAYEDLVAHNLTARPGVTELLELLARAEIPAAIVSASPRRVVELVRDRLGRHLFVAVVGFEDAPRSKPAADPYLAAAARLGVDPAKCVAVEDSPVGLASAEAAGCHVIVVPSTVPIADGPGRTILRSLEEVSLVTFSLALNSRDPLPTNQEVSR